MPSERGAALIKRFSPLKYLSFAYWELKVLFQRFSIDSPPEWKMMITLVVAEMCTGLALFGCALLLLGYRPHYAAASFSQVAIVALIILVYAANYYALLSENRWLRFRAEFESYSKTARIVGCVCVVGMVLGSIVVMLVVMTLVRRLPY